MRRVWELGLLSLGESSGGTLLLPTATRWETVQKIETDSSQRCPAKGWEATDTCCSKGNSDEILGEKMFMMSIMKHWKRLSRAFVDSPSLEVLNTKLHRTVCDLMWLWIWTNLSSRLGKMISKDPFQPKLFCDYVWMLFSNNKILCCIPCQWNTPQVWFPLTAGAVQIKFQQII